MTDYTSHPDWRAFVAAIRERPDDDLTRLVCADWLDDHGESERAEFVRRQCAREHVHPKLTWLMRFEESLGGMAHQCERVSNSKAASATGPNGVEHVFVRGFVHRVTGPLSVLVGSGKDCYQCLGFGEFTPISGPAARCGNCHGTSQTHGILRDLLRVEPVMEVEVTGVEPQINSHGRPEHLWWGSRDDQSLNSRDYLPWAVFERLEGGELLGPGERSMERHPPEEWLYYRIYPARESAIAALNRAVYKYCLEPGEVSQ